MARFREGYVDQIKVPPGVRDVQEFDEELPRFGIRKYASGRAYYFVKYKMGSQQRRVTLGKVVKGNLGDMRRQASIILSKARIGIDTQAEKRAAIGKVETNLTKLIPLYLAARKPHLRSRYYAEIERQLNTDWKPLHPQSAETLTRQGVIGVIDDIAKQHGNTAADRARMALSGFFSWVIEHGYAESNPTSHISPRSENKSRERVLSELELAEVWRACEDDDYGRIVRLLILTGQRRQEIGDLVWPEVDHEKKQMDLPAERTKNHKPHIVPLSSEALEILKGVYQEEDRDLVFGRGNGGYSGWSKSKREIDQRIAAERKKVGIKKLMPRWTVHDLRRSFVTHLNERKLALPHVIEAIVNHVSGHLAGVAGIYNKAQYIDERRNALDLWGKHVAALVFRDRGANQ